MTKFILIFYINLTFLGCLGMQVTTMPIEFYNEQAAKLLKKFDFSNEHLKRSTLFFLAQRIHLIGKAISIKENTVQIIDEAFVALESQYLNSELLEPMIKHYISDQNRNGLFMLEFAKAVEFNILHTLQNTIGFYVSDNLVEFEKNLGLQKITREEFNAKIKQIYSSNELIILSILESKKFASVVLDLLKSKMPTL